MDTLKPSVINPYEKLIEIQKRVEVPLTIEDIQHSLDETELDLLNRSYDEEPIINIDEKKKLLFIEKKLLIKRIEKNLGRTINYDVLFMTIGQTVDPIYLTIEAVRPKKVCMIATGDSRLIAEEVRELVNMDKKENKIIFDMTEINGTDTVGLYYEVSQFMETYKKQNYDSFAIDATGGKKSMSSGASLAADFWGMDLLYLDTISRSKGFYSGTQNLKILEKPEEILGNRRFVQLSDMINSGNFRSAIDFSDSLIDSLRNRHKIKAKLLQNIAKSFEQVELGNYKLESKSSGTLYIQKAFEVGVWELSENTQIKLKTYSDLVEQIGNLSDDYKKINKLSNEKGMYQNILSIWEKRNLGKRMLYAIGFMINNVIREFNNGRFDMGSLLAYRIIELTSQVALAELNQFFVFGNTIHNINNQDELLDRFKKYRDVLIKYPENEDNEFQINGKIAMFNQHILVMVFKDLSNELNVLDEIDDSQISLLSALRGKSDSRNSSRLAHGLTIISEKEANEFFELSKKIIDFELASLKKLVDCPEDQKISDYLQMLCNFPKIEI